MPSPQPGVERIVLDRIGGEVARATSLVSDAPGSRFPAHGHPGGEEILVLSGTFSDDTGDYPAGWYLRNPPGSRHAPASTPGTVIFVKLGQMAANEQRTVRIDTADPTRWRHTPGRAVCELSADGTEEVSLQRLVPGTQLFAAPVDGAELLVLDGAVLQSGRELPPRTWIRLPVAIAANIAAAQGGATIYLKTGHRYHRCACVGGPKRGTRIGRTSILNGSQLGHFALMY